MQFETRKARDAAGWHLAQAVKLHGRRLAKGSLLSDEQAAALDQQAIQVFRLDPTDLGEDAAATALRPLLDGPGLRLTPARTGRLNVLAETAGLITIDQPGVLAFNTLDEALTLATLPDRQRVAPGDLIATLKIIPFAAPREAVQAALQSLTEPLLQLRPFTAKTFDLIQTQPAAVPPALLDKARSALDARLTSLGSHVAHESRIEHSAEAVAAALTACTSDIVILFPGAATQDRRDVGPAGLEQAGGEVHQLGMPVDPGNLLFLGALRGKPVLGAPGCARSVAFNGFDWVLERLCADIPPTPTDIRALGLGGLLKEIPSRPLPRLKT